MGLKEMIAADKASIAKAKQDLDIARDIYNICVDKFTALTSPVENKHKRLVSLFISAVNSEIKADCCDSCHPKLFCKGCFTSDGITIWDEADHPHDIRGVDYTWEEVEEALKQIGGDYE